MGDPQDKVKFRRRRQLKNKYAKDLRQPKYKQRVKEDQTKKIDVSKMSHSDLVEFLNRDVEWDKDE